MNILIVDNKKDQARADAWREKAQRAVAANADVALVFDGLPSNLPSLVLQHCGGANPEHPTAVEACESNGVPIVLFSGGVVSDQMGSYAGKSTVCVVKAHIVDGNLEHFLREWQAEGYALPPPWEVLEGFGFPEIALRALTSLLPIGLWWDRHLVETKCEEAQAKSFSASQVLIGSSVIQGDSPVSFEKRLSRFVATAMQGKDAEPPDGLLSGRSGLWLSRLGLSLKPNLDDQGDMQATALHELEQIAKADSISAWNGGLKRLATTWLGI